MIVPDDKVVVLKRKRAADDGIAMSAADVSGYDRTVEDGLKRLRITCYGEY